VSLVVYGCFCSCIVSLVGYVHEQNQPYTIKLTIHHKSKTNHKPSNSQYIIRAKPTIHHQTHNTWAKPTIHLMVVLLMYCEFDGLWFCSYNVLWVWWCMVGLLMYCEFDGLWLVLLMYCEFDGLWLVLLLWCIVSLMVYGCFAHVLWVWWLNNYKSSNSQYMSKTTINHQTHNTS
jgi:hypothetical protein